MAGETALEPPPELRAAERVLVVDDDANVRETIVDMVQMGGQTCESAANVSEAMERLRGGAFDLVITDMHMPGESGLDLIERVQKMDDSIPVILVTGYPSVHSAINAMKRGAIDFITKPFDFDSITQLVAKAMRERRLRKEIRRLQADVHKAHVIERLNRELNSRIQEVTRLYTISEAFTQFMDTDALFQQVVEVAGKVTGAQKISLMMLDRGRRMLKIRASIGIPTEIVLQTRVRLGESISGTVARQGALMRANRDIHKSVAGAEQGNYASHSWLSLPVFIAGQIFGVLNMTDKPDRSDFTQEEEQIMQILVEKAGTKLENQALYEGIYANMVDTLNSLVTTIEAKDPYTREHSHRVTAYAMRVGEILGIPEDEMEMIEFAAVLHDIGKIGIRDEILCKAGNLTGAEYEQIKQHVIIGEKIVEPLGLTEPERTIIRNHHEWHDGTGYPDRLKGNDIPPLARIVAVADAFDAMTSTRPYRKALSGNEALEEIRRQRGTQFAPDIADAAISGIESGRIFVLPQGSAP